MNVDEALRVALSATEDQPAASDNGGPLAIAALTVALVAAVISGTALWRTHYSRGRLIWAPGTASLAIASFRKEGAPEEPVWFIPDLALPVTIANTGAQAVIVRGLRLRVQYPDLPIPDAHEIWELNRELDTETELRPGPGRTALVASRGTGTPFIVLPKTSIDKRFLFWNRWEKPVVQRMVFTLEVWTSRKPKWREVETWTAALLGEDWVGLPRDGFRVGLVSAGQSATRFRKVSVPEDLHKYTGPIEPLPTESGPRPPRSIVVLRETTADARGDGRS